MQNAHKCKCSFGVTHVNIKAMNSQLSLQYITTFLTSLVEMKFGLNKLSLWKVDQQGWLGFVCCSGRAGGSMMLRETVHQMFPFPKKFDWQPEAHWKSTNITTITIQPQQHQNTNNAVNAIPPHTEISPPARMCLCRNSTWVLYLINWLNWLGRLLPGQLRGYDKGQRSYSLGHANHYSRGINRASEQTTALENHTQLETTKPASMTTHQWIGTPTKTNYGYFAFF